MQFIFQIKVYWQLNCHIKYLPFRVKNYSKYGSPPIKYMSLPIRPPLLLLCPPVLVPPHMGGGQVPLHMGGGTSPPPYHQGLGKTLKQDMLNLKSSMCRKVSTVAKTILGVNITGKELFESIGSLSAPAPLGLYFYEHPSELGLKVTSKPSTSKSTSPPKTSTKAVPKQPKSTT